MQEKGEIVKSRYSLFTLILIAEYLIGLGRRFKNLSYRCKDIEDGLISLANHIITKIKDDDLLYYLLTKQEDYLGRSALEVIAKNEFLSLLEGENVTRIVNSLWYGRDNYVEMYQFSRIAKIIEASIEKQRYEKVIEHLDAEADKRNYSFQFCIFINNCSVRFNQNMILIVLLAVMFQIFVYYYIEAYIEDIIKLKEKYQDDYHNHLTYTNVEGLHSSKTVKMIKIFFCVFSFTINIQNLVHSFFYSLTKRKVSLSLSTLFDFLLLVVMLVLTFDIIEIFFDTEHQYFRLIESCLYAIATVGFWIRVASAFLVSKTLGPFINTMYVLIPIVVNFMIVFACLNFVFSQMFAVIFHNVNDNFITLFSSWTYLFSVALGEFKFENFDKNYEIGYALLILYATIGNVVLMNLVISIVENIYNINSKLSFSVNNNELILNYHKLKWHDEYGLMILLPPPFNIFTLPFILPLFFLSKERRVAYNLAIAKKFYGLIALVNFAFLLSANLVTTPAAALKSVTHTAYWTTNRHQPSSLFKLFKEIIKRPFNLIKILYQDLRVYWRVVFDESLKGSIDEDSYLVMTIHDIKRLRRSVLYEKLRTKRKWINLNEVEPLFVNQYKLKEIVSKLRSGLHSDLVKTMQKLRLEMASKLFFEMISRIKDKEDTVDVDLCMSIFSNRTFCHKIFLKTLYYYNRQLLYKGTQNYFYLNGEFNTFLSFRMIKNLILKLNIKMDILISQV